MTLVFTILGRLFLILAGYTVACLATSLFINLMVLASYGFISEDMLGLSTLSLMFSVPFIALFVAYFAIVPAMAAIALAEILGKRDWLYYALAGALAGAVVAGYFGFVVAQPDDDWVNPFAAGSLVCGGIIGGMAYWLVAGRMAGNWREGVRSAPISPEPSGS